MTNERSFEFYVGGYAEPGRRGILRCAFDAASGRISVLGGNDELRNPSWVLCHPALPLLYAVEELSPEGGLAVLSTAGGAPRVICRMSTQGADPCHLALSPDGRHLFAANYTGGSLAVYALGPDGVPTGLCDFRRHRFEDGVPSGNHPTRQEVPHIHFSQCDGDRVCVSDLGMNRVFIYGWDAAGGRLSERAEAIGFPDGYGPRHFAFGAGGGRLYALCELEPSVHVFVRDSGSWRRVQAESLVPDGFADHARYNWSLGAAVHFADAHTLCASVRGCNVIATFDVDAAGMLSNRRLAPSGGLTPRDFLPAGDWLLAANQDSDRIEVLRRDGAFWRSAGTGIDAIHPTCLCRIPR